MINYQNNLENITASKLSGFFVDWPKRPNTSTLFRILKQSTYIVIAIKEDVVIGFITAISDKVLSAYIPLLEDLPEFQGQGIGKELVREMEKQIQHLYMNDIVCDNNVVPFYEKLHYFKVNGVVKRNYTALKNL